jgi:hypothetical protein
VASKHRRIRTAGGIALAVALVVGGTLFASGVPAFATPSAGSASSSGEAITNPGTTASFSFRLDSDDGDTVEPNAPNVALRTIKQSPLLLFLAATRAHPVDYRSFLGDAQRRGYHVLALDYWNTGLSVEKTCGVDPRCYTQLQRNRLTGAHPSRFSAVNQQNSILSRLHRALDYLQTSDPHGGWNRFESGTGIDWSRIVVAGHSQGGGESAYIAHIHRVRGALFFSSPVDTVHGVAASWMGSHGATPASCMYGFVDSHDMFYPRIRGSWTKLGMDSFGAPADPLVTSDFTSHEVVSQLGLGRPSQAHLRTITDRTPRTASGSPVFSGVWKWMLAQLYSPPASAKTTPVTTRHIANS